MEDLQETGARPVLEALGTAVTKDQLRYLRLSAGIINKIYGKTLFDVVERPGMTFGDGTLLRENETWIAVSGSWVDEGHDFHEVWQVAEEIASFVELKSPSRN